MDCVPLGFRGVHVRVPVDSVWMSITNIFHVQLFLNAAPPTPGPGRTPNQAQPKLGTPRRSRDPRSDTYTAVHTASGALWTPLGSASSKTMGLPPLPTSRWRPPRRGRRRDPRQARQWDSHPAKKVARPRSDNRCDSSGVHVSLDAVWICPKSDRWVARAKVRQSL